MANSPVAIDLETDESFDDLAARKSATEKTLEELKERKTREIEALRAQFDQQIRDAEHLDGTLARALSKRMGPFEDGPKSVVSRSGYEVSRGLASKVVSVPNDNAAIRALRRRGHRSLIRKKVKITFELKRQQIKDSPHLIKGLRAVRITQSEWVKSKPPARKKKS